LPDDPTQPVEGIAHCPSCLGIIASQAHFCGACGMPLTMYSTVSPLEQVWAFGWFINRLLSQRPTLLTVVGTWALGIPWIVVLMGPVVVLFGMPRGVRRFEYSDLLFGLPSIIIAICYLLLMVRVTLRYCRQKPGDAE